MVHIMYFNMKKKDIYNHVSAESTQMVRMGEMTVEIIQAALGPCIFRPFVFHFLFHNRK